MSFFYCDSLSFEMKLTMSYADLKKCVFLTQIYPKLFRLLHLLRGDNLAALKRFS